MFTCPLMANICLSRSKPRVLGIPKYVLVNKTDANMLHNDEQQLDAVRSNRSKNFIKVFVRTVSCSQTGPICVAL